MRDCNENLLCPMSNRSKLASFPSTYDDKTSPDSEFPLGSNDFVTQSKGRKDASPSYGFGVSVLRCGREESERVGRLADKRGDYIKLHGTPDDCFPDRLGQPHLLNYHKTDFTTVISKQAKWYGHAALLEAHALLLAVKWAVRSVSNHGHRLVVLVDAKAVLGAAVKGRTSSRMLRGVLRTLAAYALATNLLLRLVYIPSEHNPADEPSRGKRLKPCVRKRLVRTKFNSRRGTRLERWFDQMEMAAHKLWP